LPATAWPLECRILCINSHRCRDFARVELGCCHRILVSTLAIRTRLGLDLGVGALQLGKGTLTGLLWFDMQFCPPLFLPVLNESQHPRNIVLKFMRDRLMAIRSHHCPRAILLDYWT